MIILILLSISIYICIFPEKSMLLYYHYRHRHLRSLIYHLDFWWPSFAYEHDNKFRINKIHCLCQSFCTTTHHHQQFNPHWGYIELSQAIEETEEDRNKIRQEDYHSDIYKIGLPKLKPKTEQEVERRLRAVLYHHDKRKDYLHFKDTDMHWDMGIQIADLNELQISTEKKTLRQIKAERQKKLLETKFEENFAILEAGTELTKLTAGMEKNNEEDNEVDWMELTRRKD